MAPPSPHVGPPMESLELSDFLLFFGAWWSWVAPSDTKLMRFLTLVSSNEKNRRQQQPIQRSHYLSGAQRYL